MLLNGLFYSFLYLVNKTVNELLLLDRLQIYRRSGIIMIVGIVQWTRVTYINALCDGGCISAGPLSFFVVSCFWHSSLHSIRVRDNLVRNIYTWSNKKYHFCSQLPNCGRAGALEIISPTLSLYKKKFYLLKGITQKLNCMWCLVLLQAQERIISLSILLINTHYIIAIIIDCVYMSSGNFWKNRYFLRGKCITIFKSLLYLGFSCFT